MYAKVFLIIIFISSFALANSQTSDSTLSERDYFIKAHAYAANDFNDSLLKEYIKLFPKGEFVQKAKVNIDICAWQNARYENTLDAYKEYLDKFPKGKAAKLAKQQIILLSDTTTKPVQ